LLKRQLHKQYRLPDEKSVQGVEIEAPVVFVGYGFKNDKLRYDDFDKLDLKGKFILRISGAPGFARTQLSPFGLSNTSGKQKAQQEKWGSRIIEFDPGLAVVGSQPENEFLNMSPSENNPAYGRQRADYSLPDKISPDNFARIFRFRKNCKRDTQRNRICS